MGCGASAKKYRAEGELQDTLCFLSKVPLFRQLPKEQHPLLAGACEAREFAPGQVVIKKGDVGRVFFVIRSGEASVHTVEDEGARVANPKHWNPRLKTGDYFGEKALIHDAPRSATIIAETNLWTFQITRAKFRELGLNEKLHFAHRKAVGVGKAANKSMAQEAPPKSIAEQLFIAEALRRNENLQVMVVLDNVRLDLMIDVCWKETVKKGEYVISEEDPNADYFYVIQDGSFQVTARAGGDKSRELKSLGRGDSFGEMALLYLAPRSATVTALADSTLWVFDRDNFKKILMRNTTDQVKKHSAYLDHVEILQCLLPNERHAISEAFLEFHYDQGEMIFEQGQTGIAFYILIDGEVAVIKDGKEVRRLTADAKDKTTAIFGEMALLNNKPRTASIKVVSQLAKALALDRDSFDMLLGPLEDLIKETQTAPRRLSRVGSTKLKSKAKTRAKAVLQDELAHVGLLGCGGFGTVDLCEHKQSKEIFALKSMSKGHIVETGMRAMVINEKDILFMCDSPFIIRLYATYNTPQHLQLLLEPALGGDLHVAFQRKGLYGSTRHTVFYSAAVICAFQHLHGIKVIYRDLKPENVLLNATGHVKLTDMGLAKVCPGKTYTVCGTPDYFAPEMLKQIGHSFGLDWWTLGVFIFELLTGEPPFEAPEPMQVYKNISQGIDQVSFPSSFTNSASSLIRGLLFEDPCRRLPMTTGGVANLEEHRFYTDLNWTSFRELRAEPPYRPRLSGRKDRSNFRARPSDVPPQVPYENDGTGWDTYFASC